MQEIWEELGLQPMDSDEVTADALGAVSVADTQTSSSSDSREDVGE